MVAPNAGLPWVIVPKILPNLNGVASSAPAVGARLGRRSAAASPEHRSASEPSSRIVVAKLLRLVSATQPRSGDVPRLAAFAGLRLNVRVSQPPKPRRPRPPHNPGVRDLVEGKRRWATPTMAENLKQGFRGWNERGYLPHRDEPGLAQFVTFRLADSFPEALCSEWEQKGVTH